MNQTTTHSNWIGNDLILRLRLTPRSSRDQVLDIMGDRLKISITAPPVDGKANKHLVKFLAKQFRVAKSQICIVSGETDRDKTLRIEAPGCLPDEFQIPGSDEPTKGE